MLLVTKVAVMRRTSLVVLTSSAVALAVLVWFSSTTSESARGEAKQETQQGSLIDAELNESAVALPPRSRSSDDQDRTVSDTRSDTDAAHEYVAPSTPTEPLIDEDAFGESMREGVAGTVRTDYSLLFEHLNLAPREADALLALLIEDELSSWTISNSRGDLPNEDEHQPMNEDERSNSIAAIIGYPKLQRFLALERNLPAYGEVQRIASLFQQNDVPLTDTQRDGLFEILVETRYVYETRSPADVKRDSIEFLEQQLTQVNEYQRLVMELAPSVLSSQQVVYLHEQYQYLSYERAYALERQKDKRASPMIQDRHLSYPAWSYE